MLRKEINTGVPAYNIIRKVENKENKTENEIAIHYKINCLACSEEKKDMVNDTKDESGNTSENNLEKSVITDIPFVCLCQELKGLD